MMKPEQSIKPSHPCLFPSIASYALVQNKFGDHSNQASLLAVLQAGACLVALTTGPWI
jgi:hypothetical protein